MITNRVFIPLFLAAVLTGGLPGPLAGQATLGARSIALGRAATALPGCPWAVFENPAMAGRERATVSFFGIRYYGIPELTDMAAAIVVPTGYGVVGGGAHRFGDKLYSESRLRLIYKHSYEAFHYGVSLNYTHVVQGGGYGSVGALGIDVGLAAQIAGGFWVGAKATNINRPRYGRINNIEEDLPRNLSIGLAYRLSTAALLVSEVYKDVRFPLSYRAGVEISIVEHLRVRAGVTTAPQTFAGGLGYDTGRWGVNIVVQRHEVKALGYSPGFDFNISW